MVVLSSLGLQHDFMRANSAFDLVTSVPNRYSTRRLGVILVGLILLPIPNLGGVGERFNPPVLQTGSHFVGREFKSRPLRHFKSAEC